MKIYKELNWYDEEHNLNVFYADFPKGVDEFVTCNEDGSYSAFIACNRCREKIKEAYCHAVSHIVNDDFCSESSVQKIESQRHGLK